MSAKIRIKCPHCGEAKNVHSVNDICPNCKQPLGLSEEGSIYIYRQGSVYGVAGGFGLFINNQPYGYIGNKELLRIPKDRVREIAEQNIDDIMNSNRRDFRF